MTDADAAGSDVRDPDIVVLRREIHSMPVGDLADELAARLPDHAVAVAHTPTEERELLARARIAVGLELDADHLEVVDDLDLFACGYAGTGHLPLEALADRGVRVTNASGVHGPNAAEHVLGGVLHFARGFHHAVDQASDREWRSYSPSELAGSTVTVVGMGAIGAAALERLDAFAVHTIGARFSPEKGGPADEVIGFRDTAALHDALARTDYLALTCPLTDETRGLIGRDELVTLPSEAVISNVARGAIIDTEALVAELQRGQLRGAHLDVTDPEPLPPEHPLWTFENVLVTPHTAGQTPAYYQRLADIVARNVRHLEAGEELENRVG